MGKGVQSAATKTRGRGTKRTQRSNAPKKGSAFTKSDASTKVGRRAAPGHAPKKGSRERSANTIRRLNMYKTKMPTIEQRQGQATKPHRIAPDRRWFGNTRVITQKKMQDFRQELSKSVQDPFSVVLKSSKLPLSLLQDSSKAARMNLLSVESYESTFGRKKQRKRPKLAAYDLEGLVAKTAEKDQQYNEGKDADLGFDTKTGVRKPAEEIHLAERIFNKGTSRRIWGELYKVIDSSDVLIQVLDARDPMGTRCQRLEREVRKNHPHKHILLLLNKVDLIPTWATKRWVEVLRKEFPALAFHASITNPFGKSALIQLLRQFSNLLQDRKHVSVGFIGYPNVGKSSVINALRKKKVCKAAPVPGETKIWQYISLTKRLYLIDSPGHISAEKHDFASDCAKLLKGAVRVERVMDPSTYIPEVLARVKPSYLLERYKLPADTTWADAEEFLSILGRKMGKLRKGGESDVEITARIVLYDWQRGRIPFFTAPPPSDKEGRADAAKEAEEQEEEAAEKAEKAEKVEVTVEQSFTDLKCSVPFDKADAVAQEASAATTSAAEKAAKAPEAKASEPQAVTKAEAKAEPQLAGAAVGDSAAERPRKKRKEAHKKGAPAPAMATGGEEKAEKAEKAGGETIDWAKVMEEFGT